MFHRITLFLDNVSDIKPFSSQFYILMDNDRECLVKHSFWYLIGEVPQINKLNIKCLPKNVIPGRHDNGSGPPGKSIQYWCLYFTNDNFPLWLVARE